jgi:translocation and assembly module TamB
MRRFFKSIEAIKGNGSFVFLITGDWNNPVINGGSTIADGTLGIKEFPHRIYDLKSYIFVDNNTVVVESLSGKMGGGNIHMKGYGLIKNFSLQSFSLDAQLTDVTLKITRGFMVNFNGNLIYRGEKGKNSMVGQVEIIQARYSQRIDWKTQLLKPKLAEKPRGTLNPFLETELNIKVDGTNEIIVDNNIAKTSLNVDLLLRGTIANPLLFGRIETNKGKVYFRNNEFDIIHASADFVDPEKLNPYFDVTATTSVKGYNIRITIEGQIQHFDLSLLSDPRLDETDILSLLAVGELGGKTKGMEGGMGTAEATSFLTGEYQDVIEERLTSITGFDRFQVEPYVSEKKGTVGPRVTVSKRLIGDKLYLSYSSAFEATQADIIKLEYQIDKHVSLVGFRDQLGSIGSDVRFRFEFK